MRERPRRLCPAPPGIFPSTEVSGMAGAGSWGRGGQEINSCCKSSVVVNSSQVWGWPKSSRISLTGSVHPSPPQVNALRGNKPTPPGS